MIVEKGGKGREDMRVECLTQQTPQERGNSI